MVRVMPNVQRQSTRPLVQALVVRLYGQHIRLVIDSILEDRSHWPNDEVQEVERVVPRRVKGSKTPLSPESKLLVEELQPQLKTMLRYDWDYGLELVRDVHGQLAQAYPLARGCDISKANEMIQRGLERLEKHDMHGLWYWLDRALEIGLEICEQCKYRDVYEDPEGREEARRR